MSKEIFVAFATQKGGIGKSTVTALAASYLHNVKGYNVAVVDCDDPQHSIHGLREHETALIGRSIYFKALACDHFRKIRAEATRRARLREHLQTNLSADALPVNERLDLQFRLAAYQVALDRLRHDASLSPLQRAVLDECILNEGSPTALARRLGRFPNTIVQIRRRLLARVRAYLDTFYAT